MRTDENLNPTAFTTDIAKEAGLALDVDYEPGTPFPGTSTLVTAKLLKDPVATTIQVIDKLSFYTAHGGQRWIYIGIPPLIWKALSNLQKTYVIWFMYQHEGGTEMADYFKKLLGIPQA
jgi:hypothetical protein